jgi:hypothetical protein
MFYQYYNIVESLFYLMIKKDNLVLINYRSWTIFLKLGHLIVKKFGKIKNNFISFFYQITLIGMIIW